MCMSFLYRLYVLVYAWAYVNMYMYTYIHTYLYLYTYTHIYMYIYAFTCFFYTHVHIHLSICLCMNLSEFTYDTCEYAHKYTNSLLCPCNASLLRIWRDLPAEKWHSKKKCRHVLTSIEGQHPRLLYLARTGRSWVCITKKVGPRLQLLKERSRKTHFESISLPPGNNRPRQGRKIGNQGLASFQEYILTNAQDATTWRSTGHRHRATSGPGHKDVTKPQHGRANARQD